jgi:choline-sulfatase
MSKRTNILLIIADQMTALALPFYGHAIVKSPNLSGLAERGVVFESAYCNSPLCAPSRASMMTGLLPSRIGAYDNAAEFPPSIPTLGHYLRQMGYYTGLCGKMHFVGPDQLHGFEERLTTDIYPADMGWTPDWECPQQRPSWYHNMLSVVQAGPCLTTNQIDFDEEVVFHAVRKLHELARGDDARPFCLVVSFTHPHDPFAITQEYWSHYDHAAIDLPTVGPIPLERMDPHSQRLHHVCDLTRYRQTEERVRNARHAYYAMISYVDDKVGQLLRTLDATGLSDDTIVIFTSDHGEMLGERGLWYKMNFFEWSARVPLIFWVPGLLTPHRVAGHVSLVDLLPTVVELAAGESVPDLTSVVDGRSLVSLLHGEEVGPVAPAPGRHRTGQHGDDPTCTVLGEILCEGAIAPCLMIRRGRYKYIYSEPDPEQLYDLESDPSELVNLAGRPDHKALQQGFRAEIQQHWNPHIIHQQVLESQRRRRLVAQALATGRRTAWDFQPFKDASKLYMRGYMNLDEVERCARFPTPAIPAPDCP